MKLDIQNFLLFQTPRGSQTHFETKSITALLVVQVCRSVSSCSTIKNASQSEVRLITRTKGAELSYFSAKKLKFSKTV